MQELLTCMSTYDINMYAHRQHLFTQVQDVLLQQAAQPYGMRQMAVFSSLRYKPKSNDKAGDKELIKNYVKAYKYAGLAVTPFTPRLGSDGFQQSQGFVATFTGIQRATARC